MTEHTPGPWEAKMFQYFIGIRLGQHYKCAVHVHFGDTKQNIPNYGTREEAEANAALIARAPELLAENETLKKRIAELEAERDWRPIETAPKDGSPFIGYNPEYKWVGTVRFDLPDDPDPEIGSPTLAFFGTTVRCTHWMPLPEMEDE